MQDTQARQLEVGILARASQGAGSARAAFGCVLHPADDLLVLGDGRDGSPRAALLLPWHGIISPAFRLFGWYLQASRWVAARTRGAFSLSLQRFLARPPRSARVVFPLVDGLPRHEGAPAAAVAVEQPRVDHVRHAPGGHAELARRLRGGHHLPAHDVGFVRLEEHVDALASFGGVVALRLGRGFAVQHEGSHVGPGRVRRHLHRLHVPVAFREASGEVGELDAVPAVVLAGHDRLVDELAHVCPFSEEGEGGAQSHPAAFAMLRQVPSLSSFFDVGTLTVLPSLRNTTWLPLPLSSSHPSFLSRFVTSLTSCSFGIGFPFPQPMSIL